jgi:GNAT superfamily N-acetyltransferase
MDGVRPARHEDRAALTSSIAAAFARDPAWSFLLGDDYDLLAPLFAGVLFDLRVGTGDIWVTSDLTSAALWDPPGWQPTETEPSGPFWDAYRAAAGAPGWDRLMTYERALDAVRPTTSHWYLGVLATRPDGQGKGRASAVLAPILKKADHDGMDCCLETSTARNRAFYERRGFTEATDVTISSGPPTWWLRRPPQKPA